MWERLFDKGDYEIHRYDGAGKSVYIAPVEPAWARVNDTGGKKLQQLMQADCSAVERLFSKNSLKLDKLGEHHILRNPVLRLTNRCNLKCSHCYQASPESMRRRKHDLTVQDVEGFLAFAANQSKTRGWEIKTIQLFGGESSLNPKFLEILELIVEANLSGIRVSTNGVPKLLRSDDMLRFYEMKNIEWRVGLESHKEEFQNRVRPNDSYGRVLETIEKVVKNGGNVTAKAVLNKENLTYLGETLKFLRDIGVRQYSYNILSLIGSAAKNNLQNSVDHLEAVTSLTYILEQDISLAKMLHPTPFGRWLKLIYGADGEAYPRIQFFVDADGGVYPNDTLYENSAFCVGNVSSPESALYELLSLQKKLEVGKSSCSVCPIRPFCFKGNYGLLYENDHTMESEFVECESMRESVYYLMQLGERGRQYARAMYD
jgi:radical SAM protein with 4Fe4S-binding SPASM domain